MDISALHEVVDLSRLPTVLGGDCLYVHTEWVRLRQYLESLKSLCCHVMSVLLGVAQEMVQNSMLPLSAEVARDLLQRHDQSVECLLTDDCFLKLQTDGAEWLEHISNSTELVLKHQEARTSRILKKLYPFLLKAFLQMSSLAKERRSKLVTGVKLREFEEKANEILSRLSATKGELCKEFSGTLAEDLPSIDLCRLKLCRLEMTVQVEIDAGKGLLEEVKLIMDGDERSDIMVVADLTKALKCTISGLTDELKKVHQKIDLTRQCLKSLERAYEWLSDAKNFLALLDSKGRIMSPESVNMNLEAYLHDHPANLLIQTLDNFKAVPDEVIQHKCRTASDNITETVNIFKLKQSRANRELLATREWRLQLASGSASCVQMRSNASSNNTVSTAEDQRRRSYAGRTSVPIYGSWRHSLTGLEKDPDLQAYVEYLFQGGLITDNMSERVVASLPKCLSDSTMRSSRESLRSSRDSLRESCESLAGLASFDCLTTSSQVDLNQTEVTSNVGPRDSLKWRFFQKAQNLFPDRSRSIQSLRIQNEIHPVSRQSFSQNQRSPLCHQPRPSVVANNSAASTSHNGASIFQELSPQEHISAVANSSVKTSQRNLALMMQEMIDTEFSYINSLKFVITNYIPELCQDDVMLALQGKRYVIFGNLEKICEFHSQSFVAELEQCINAPLCVGRAFLRHASEFYMYALYSKNKPKSDSLMVEYGTSFFRKKQGELGDRMDLSSYLLKPIQRMGKYALLLEQMLKQCNPKDPNHTCLKDALELVRFQLRHGNDLLAMDCIRHCDVNLQEQGMLLRQDEFLVWQGNHKCRRHVFLFEGLVLFSKTKRHSLRNEHYLYKNGFKTCEIGITENVTQNEKLQFEIWFRKRIPKFTYILQATSAHVRQAWINEIARILWKQAVQSREHNLSKMLQMGIGRKETNGVNRLSNGLSQLSGENKIKQTTACIVPANTVQNESMESQDCAASLSQYKHLVSTNL